MAALRIVLGKDVAGKIYPVYVGRSGTEAEEAKAKDKKAETFESFTGITGVRKRNPNFRPPTEK